MRRSACASGIALLLSACALPLGAPVVATDRPDLSVAAERIAESSARTPDVDWEQLKKLAHGFGKRITVWPLVESTVTLFVTCHWVS